MTRIDGLNPLSTSRTQGGYGPGGVDGAGANGRNNGADRVAGRQDELSLSNRGRVIAEAARAVGDSPEVRADKVAALKAAIADGTYRSNARDIAERLMASGTFGLE